MGFTIEYAAGKPVVLCDDDFATFDSILDRFDHQPRLCAARLTVFVEDHPWHLDVIAHLASLHDNLHDVDAALRWAAAARDVLDAGLGGHGTVLLDPADFAHRRVLRCARNATAAAWGAGDWELAAELAELRARVDTHSDATEWITRIAARAPQGAAL